MRKTSYQCIAYLFGLTAILSCLSMQNIFAGQYRTPPANNAIIGNMSYTTAYEGDSLITIGQRNNIGVNAMVDANPGLGETTRLHSGTYVKIPSKFLLPPLPRKGIVINLPEMRMYYYQKDSSRILTYPVGIGRIGKTIPIEKTYIAKKTVNPTWTPPKDIRQWNKEQGVDLPATMGPGPDNPLGPYAIYLGIPTFLIHSTIFPESIGRRASFGCIRMNEMDIKQFFPAVQRGTPVIIIDMPIKIGWNGNHLYLESHPPLEETSNDVKNDFNGFVETIDNALPHNKVTMVNWQLVAYLAEEHDGIPHQVGFEVK